MKSHGRAILIGLACILCAGCMAASPLLRRPALDVKPAPGVPMARFGRVSAADERPAILPAGFQDDARRLTLGLQFSNTSDYLGYRLTSNLGFRWVRRSEQGGADTNAMAFVDVFAGLGTDR